MPSLGMQEIIVIFILALIVFGPRKLPELGKTLGKGMAEFKKASSELKQTWEDEVAKEKEVLTSTLDAVNKSMAMDNTDKEKEALASTLDDANKSVASVASVATDDTDKPKDTVQ